MKLLFDQNLSFRLPGQLADIFPGSSQVRLLGLDQADDREIWTYAGAEGFDIVSLDADFGEMAALFGPPPRVIWLRCGNRPTVFVEALLRRSAGAPRLLEHSRERLPGNLLRRPLTYARLSSTPSPRETASRSSSPWAGS